jgi:hypothetical protein
MEISMEHEHDNSGDTRLREVEMKFATHEAVCAERYAGIQKDVGGLNTGLSDLKTLIVRIGIGIAFGMASILASIAFKQ